jgi:hypothetical protein
MKITELMIGDYVKYQGCIYIIEEISAKGWVHLIHPEAKVRINMTSDYIMHLLEPIPLTTEILKNNGLEKIIDEDGTECYRYYNRAADGYVKISLYDGGDSDWSIEIINYEKFNDNEIIYSNNFIFLKVHELQHILRVCNLNELADNLKLK